MSQYEVVVVGGGITGAANCYALAQFSDVERIALVEKEADVGGINSRHTHNSQTLHFGDVETNYSRDRAETVTEAAELVAGYLERVDPDREFHRVRSKMVLGVGDEEGDALRRRYYEEGFDELFPKLRPIGREEIADYEPAVVDGRDPDEPVFALHTPDGYTVDFGALARSFVREIGDTVDVYTETPVTDVSRTGRRFAVETPARTIDAEAVVVAAGPYSLELAHRMGYGESLSLLPVAGSFFAIDDGPLNGKVYTVQRPDLPFAAIHGDAEVYDADLTRFGPTAKVVPTLERGRYATIPDFLSAFGLRYRAIRAYASLLADRSLLPFILRNLVYDAPLVGRRAFVPHVRKIVPAVRTGDIARARGYGGVRPQLIDVDSGSLRMTEVTLADEGIVFNVTPSPGASVCLQNARRDTKRVLRSLGDEYAFDDAAFEAATTDHFPRE
ncbi:FAD-dependent oxidoreductase [Halovivax gelatinilyticus]|uniref:FAD-dependent oxidoreductase n=1 Tax=Halovivax gelatinilyticus TaxID=2961597 RepID=UPI0020CA3BD3|nr:FAD-dependent oxidoreductase [Halovivax gelatinilyticus]